MHYPQISYTALSHNIKMDISGAVLHDRNLEHCFHVDRDPDRNLGISQSRDPGPGLDGW